MPMTIKIPINAVIENPWPAASRAMTIPTSATGMVNSMMKGSRSDRNCDAMIMNTTITANPSARPRPENVLRMSCTCPTKSNRTCAVLGSFASAASMSVATVPISRPSTCARMCTARCSWFRSTATGPTERRMVLYAPRLTAFPSLETRTGS